MLLTIYNKIQIPGHLICQDWTGALPGSIGSCSLLHRFSLMDQALWQCTCSLSLPLAWPPWRFPYHGSHHSSLSSKAPSSEKNFCVISEEITPPIKTQCHLSCFVLFLIFLLKQGCQFVPYTSTIMTNPKEHIIRLPACLDCLRWHWLIPVAVWLLIALLPNTKIAWSINCITYILNKNPFLLISYIK